MNTKTLNEITPSMAEEALDKSFGYDYTSEQINELFPSPMTAKEVLTRSDGAWEGFKDIDRVWVILHSEALPAKVSASFAVWCTEQALPPSLSTESNRECILLAINVAKACLRGEVEPHACGVEANGPDGVELKVAGVPRLKTEGAVAQAARLGCLAVEAAMEAEAYQLALDTAEEGDRDYLSAKVDNFNEIAAYKSAQVSDAADRAGVSPRAQALRLASMIEG